MPRRYVRYNWPEVQAFYDSGKSRSECMAKFNISGGAWIKAMQRDAIVKNGRMNNGCIPTETVESGVVVSKICGKCKKSLPAFLFAKKAGRNGKLTSYCNPCQSRYSRVLNAAKNYGLSEQGLVEIERRSAGKCESCKRAGRLCIDHNHSTGKVRGMLCHQCNIILGFSEDDPAIIQLISDGLQRYLRTS